ncbi:12354_t:CDS:2 [Acaulospora morrowiae]|uniref:12354_t:CDS:1 n=1 Tax=Acaulospora morrowiae TaxID=94023 RepID=A0A9N8ZWX2_9GLOM|nr:12354_t:CDS:2 [Acaulospora morrowiae]
MSNQIIYKLHYTNSLGKTFYIDDQGGVYEINDLNCSVLIGHLTDISLMDSIGTLILNSYQVEVLTSSPTKRHVCIFCEKAFQSPSALRTHKNSHTREKQYRCEVEECGKIYTTNSNLLRHKKKHNQRG